MFIIHIHNWSEWLRAKHSWLHYEEIYRHCKTCPEKEYQLLSMVCPTKKRTGEYCYWCRGYAKQWEAHFDKVQVICDNRVMNKGGRPIKKERNTEMLKKRRSGYTLPMLMEEYGLKKSTVSEVLKRTALLEAQTKQS